LIAGLFIMTICAVIRAKSAEGAGSRPEMALSPGVMTGRTRFGTWRATLGAESDTRAGLGLRELMAYGLGVCSGGADHQDGGAEVHFSETAAPTGMPNALASLNVSFSLE
jgi:hypothetical protein